MKSLVVWLCLTSLCWAGSARDFDGTNDEVNWGDQTQYQMVSAVSHCFWLDMDATGFQTAFGKPDHSTHTSPFFDYSAELTPESGRIQARTDSVFTNTGTGLFVDGTWAHVCSVWDGAINSGSLDVYIDLSKTDGSNTTTNITDGAQTLRSGENVADTSDLNAQLAYVVLYNRLLTAAEVAELQIRPDTILDGMVLNCPMLGDDPEIDWSSYKQAGTVSGSTSITDGPPVILGDAPL